MPPLLAPVVSHLPWYRRAFSVGRDAVLIAGRLPDVELGPVGRLGARRREVAVLHRELVGRRAAARSPRARRAARRSSRCCRRPSARRSRGGATTSAAGTAGPAGVGVIHRLVVGHREEPVAGDHRRLLGDLQARDRAQLVEDVAQRARRVGGRVELDDRRVDGGVGGLRVVTAAAARKTSEDHERPARRSHGLRLTPRRRRRAGPDLRAAYSSACSSSRARHAGQAKTRTSWSAGPSCGNTVSATRTPPSRIPAFSSTRADARWAV
jgi:hypothetical protein